MMAGKAHRPKGHMDVPVQPDHGRQGKRLVHRAQGLIIGLDQFALIKVNENEGAFYRTDHQWAEILIQYQNPAVHALS